MFSFKVAIIGRPNVGKSTLFNRLVRSNCALTYNYAGVTRDVKEKVININNYSVTLLDSPGMFDYSDACQDQVLVKAIEEKLYNIIQESHLILFVTDGKTGITPIDNQISQILRKSNKDTILVINKSEGFSISSEGFGLGFPTVQISAEHNLNINDLLSAITHILDNLQTVPLKHTNNADTLNNTEHENNQVNSDIQDKGDSLKLAFIGRPNVGKSTLVNQLLGRDQQLVADFPGLTRESASFDFVYKNQLFKIIDTPGVRRKTKIYSDLEKISVKDALRAYRNADAVILVIDATSLKNGYIERQDLTLASHILEDGKLLVIAFNKCDQTPYNKNDQPKFLIQSFRKKLAQNKQVPFVFISAKNNINLDKLLDLILMHFNKYKIKISTSKLNNWMVEINQLANTHIKLKYITQIGQMPPTFLIFKKQTLRQDQEQFILNHFKEHFNLQSVIVKLIFKTK